MRFMRIVNAIAGLIMAAAAISVNAACRIDVEICAAGSPWFSASFFTVQIEFPGTEERGSLAFSFAEPGSLAIDSELTEPGQTRKGKILLLDNQLMLTNFEPEKGQEIYALDSPVLIYQLAITLLSTAFPEGPQDFKGKSVVELEDAKRGIAVATSSTSGFYGAPWRLTGSIRRTNTQSIAYDFEFESLFSGGRTRKLALKGVWTKSSPAVLDPTLSLTDWNAYALEGYNTRQDGAAISGGAKAIPPIKGTLGDLQYALRKSGPPGYGGGAGRR